MRHAELLVEADVLRRKRGGDGDADARRNAGLEATRLKRDALNVVAEIAKINRAIELLGPITESINSRLNIVHYHYKNWKDVKETGTYAGKLSERLGGNGHVNAIKYNAEVIAFLQNAHALCDSLPYVLNLYLRVVSFDSRSIGWTQQSIELLETGARNLGENLLADRLVAFSKQPLFSKLQDIVNCAKHKHLVPIFYANGRTVFAESDGEWKASETDVHEFMVAVDNVLLPLVLDMLRLTSQHCPSS